LGAGKNILVEAEHMTKVTLRQVEFGADPNKFLNNIRRQMNKDFRKEMFQQLFRQSLKEIKMAKEKAKTEETLKKRGWRVTFTNASDLGVQNRKV
tara:strand:+ start:870 stop:1154 length:285 start_codon:yes stop_codon:yes gene_type:complete